MSLPPPPLLPEVLRLQILREYDVMEAPPEEALDDLTKLTAQLCGMPIALISLVGEHRQWFMSRSGLAVPETPRHISFCTHALGQHGLFIVPDASKDPRFATSPLVIDGPGIRFYAGAPLISPEGAALGTLCVMDHAPREPTPELEHSLRMLSRQVMTHLELRRRLRELQSSKDEGTNISSSSLDAIIVIDEQGAIREFNPAAETIFGHARADVLGRTLADVIVPPELREAHQTGLHRYLKTGQAHIPGHRLEITAVRSNGEAFPVELSVVRSPGAGPPRFIGFVRDISKRRRAEAALNASEGKLRAIFEGVPDCVKLITPEGVLCEMNAAGAQIMEAESPDALLGRNLLPAVVPEDRAAISEMLRTVAAGQQQTRQFRITGLRGTLRWLEMKAVPFQGCSTGPPLVLGISHDITDQKRRDQKIHRLNRLYAISSQVNEAIIRIRDPKLLYGEACRIAVGQGGLVMAWVGRPAPADGKLIPIAIHGRDKGYIEAVVISVRPGAQSVGPAGIAFRENRTAFCNDVAFDPAMDLWRQEALSRGYQSIAAFPLRAAGNPESVFTVYADQPGYFNTDEIQLLEALAENISFALAALRRDQNRREAETALRASEQRYRDIVEVSPDAIFIILNERITYINAAGLKLLGATHSSQIIGRSPLDFFTTEFHDTVSGRIAQLKEKPSTVPLMAEKMRALDGTMVDVDVVAASYPVQYGMAIQVICRDLSVQKKAGAEIRRTTDLLRAIADGIPDTVFVKDLQGRYLLMNQAAAGFLGRELTDLIGRDDTGVFGPEEAIVIRESDQTVLDSGIPVTTEQKLTGAGGIRTYLTTKAPYRDRSGQLLGILGISRDISALKLADAHLKLLETCVDRLNDIVIITGAEPFDEVGPRILFVNDAFIRRTGYTRGEVLGQSPRLLQGPKTSRAELDRIRTALQKWQPVRAELINYTKSGEEFWVEIDIVPVAGSTGGYTHWVAVERDISERKNLEQQFLRSQRMDSIGTLAGGIAHDLNNSLSPIIMSLDLMKLRFPDPESGELLDMVGSSAQRGADMVRQLLSFARGVESQRLDVNVAQLIRDVGKIANDTFLKHIAIHTRIAPDLWTVPGDPTQIHQILVNLCVNARDAMPRGGTLTISAGNIIVDSHYSGLSLEAAPGPHVYLEIMDTGTGMTPAVMERIFDPFFTTKELGQGTGLGLSTSIAIIKSHGGFLEVKSEPGRGTTFKIHLPAHPASIAEISPAGPLPLPRGHGELILVIDDEASVRHITRRTLETYGYHVITATDGADGVALYAGNAGEIKAVLTDMMMPILDGPSTIQVLRHMNPRLPIIAVSGLPDKAHAGKAASAGIEHFLPKPYTAEILLNLLHKILLERGV